MKIRDTVVIDQCITIEFEEGDEPLWRQAEVFLEALVVYSERNVEYKDSWMRMGWRGMLVRIRERSERLWDSLWDTSPVLVPPDISALDDAIDLINFTGFLVRAVRDGNRDGTWWS